jgi:hypothetical protein
MRRTSNLRELILEVTAFALLQGSIVLLYKNNVLLWGVLLLEALAALRLWHEPHDVVFFLVIAVLGSVAEAIFVQFNVWRYANPTTLGVPLWFPVSFGLAGLIGQRIVHTILALWQELRSRQTGIG